MLNRLYEILCENINAKFSEKIKLNYIEDNLSSIQLTIDNDAVISQITIWGDFSCHVEIYKLKIDKVLVNKRVDLYNINEVLEEFNNFISTIKSIE